MDINSEQYSRIRKANVANILKKLKEGKTLSRDDWSQIEDYKAKADKPIEDVTEIKKTAKSWVELAEVLGVARQTVDVWKKKPGSPKPRSNGTHDVLKWVAFIKAEGLAAKGQSETPDEAELRLRKLFAEVEDRELKVLVRKGQFVPIDAVRERWLYHIGQANALLRNKLENELPPLLVGRDAVDIRKENARVVDEYIAIMNSGEQKQIPKLETRGRKKSDDRPAR